MNKKDRAQLAKAIGFLEEAKAIIDDLAASEREKYDNMPESLQQGDRGTAMEEAANALEEAQTQVDEALSTLGNIEG